MVQYRIAYRRICAEDIIWKKLTAPFKKTDSEKYTEILIEQAMNIAIAGMTERCRKFLTSCFVSIKSEKPHSIIKP